MSGRFNAGGSMDDDSDYWEHLQREQESFGNGQQPDGLNDYLDLDLNDRKSQLLAEFLAEFKHELFEAAPPKLLPVAGIFGGDLRIRQGTVCLIAAAAGHGKSALSLQLAYKLAQHDPEARVMVVNVEMSEQELMERLLSHICKVNLTRIADRSFRENSHYGAKDQAAILRGLAELERISDRWCMLCLDRRLSTLKAEVEAFKPTLVVLDYAQKFLLDGSNESLEHLAAASDFATDCKREHGATVLIASAVTREALKPPKRGEKPVLDMQCIKGGTELEHASDMILTLRTDFDENPKIIKHKVELRCCKDRHGSQAGKVFKMEFKGVTQSFMPEDQPDSPDVDTVADSYQPESSDAEQLQKHRSNGSGEAREL